MKVFAVLLLVSFALGHQTQQQQSEWKQFYKFAVAKAMESCLGKDNVNKYTVNMKKAVAKCQQQDAPELDLPPYRSMYKFVNTLITSADQMDQQKLHQVFVMLRMMNNQQEYEHYNNYNSGSNWVQEKWMKYKMHKMMQHIMNEDQNDFNVRPYSFDNKMDKFDMMKDNKMGKFEMMKMMKDIMRENKYTESSDKFEMMKMMKEFFGNEHSTDKYEMMEKFFKNDNDMEAFEMMKMMMKFSGNEKNMDMSEMMQTMEKLYGNNYKMTEQDYNKFDMMKMMNGKNYDDKDFKNYNYAPPQARFRFRRQASGSTKPADYSKPAPGLDRGDRLFAKLQEQKKDMEAHVGNMTCVLRETNVLNKENEIDVQALKKSLEQFTMPSPWFKNRFDELIDVCYQTAVNIPASIVDEHNVEGDFGKVNLAHVKTFMKCCKEGKQKLCMNLDTKNKIESNFGPIKTILEETKLTEYQLFPLVQQMLQGEESEYMGFM
jgi:hypothetical protein